MKVYLATSGEYSDYRVQHVFTREEDARSYPLGDDVEERELHDGPVEVRTWYTLRWYLNTPDRKGGAHHMGNPYESSEMRDFDGRPGHVQHSWWAVGTQLLIEGWDRDGVLKVYSEQRAQYLATQTGA